MFSEMYWSEYWKTLKNQEKHQFCPLILERGPLLKTDPLNVRQGPSECLFLYIVNDAKWA